MPSTILSDNGVTSNTSGIKVAGSNDGILELQTTTAGGTATTAMTINTGQAVTFAQTANLPNTFGFKNRIINGAMVIDQRNAGASVTPANGAYTLDRWSAWTNGSGVFSVQQSSVAPAGFNNSCLLTVTTADASVTGSDYYLFSQPIEGFNFSDTNFGTANAKTVTISFWVRSSITGTFGNCLRNSAGNYSYPFQYVINSADTWEQKSVTITGATAGTWLTTNGVGARLWISIGAGSDFTDTVNVWTTKASVVSANSSTNLISTSGATFYITGVQLEVGSTATSFDYRDYGRELIMCQRYYYRLSLPTDGNRYFIGFNLTTTTAEGIVFFKSSMRAAPTALEQTGTASNYSVLNQTTNVASSSVPTFNAATVDNASVLFTVSSGLTAGNGVVIRSNAASTYLGWSAEL
jgi:hypothetical protein